MRRYRIALLAVVGLAVFGVAVWLAVYAGRGISILNIAGPDGVSRWSCTQYTLTIPSANPPGTAAVSTTLGAIYGTQECKTPVASVAVNTTSGSASFFFRSPVLGTAAVTAKASAGADKSWRGTKNVVIGAPKTVPSLRAEAERYCCGRIHLREAVP